MMFCLYINLFVSKVMRVCFFFFCFYVGECVMLMLVTKAQFNLTTNYK